MTILVGEIVPAPGGAKPYRVVFRSGMRTAIEIDATSLKDAKVVLAEMSEVLLRIKMLN